MINYILGLFGRKLVPRSLGQWYVADGKVCRRSVRLPGWYIVGKELPDDASYLERALGRAVRPEEE